MATAKKIMKLHLQNTANNLFISSETISLSRSRLHEFVKPTNKDYFTQNMPCLVRLDCVFSRGLHSATMFDSHVPYSDNAASEATSERETALARHFKCDIGRFSKACRRPAKVPLLPGTIQTFTKVVTQHTRC